MQIRTGIGINDVKFGLTENEVLDLIGQPTLIQIDEEDEDKNRVYQYDKLKMKLTFYNKYDGKLGYVRTANPEIKINGQPVIGMEIDKAIKAFGLKKSEWNKEHYFTFNSYFNEGIWTTLNEEYGVVTDIEFGFLLDESGENPIWPK